MQGQIIFHPPSSENIKWGYKSDTFGDKSTQQFGAQKGNFFIFSDDLLKRLCLLGRDDWGVSVSEIYGRVNFSPLLP